MHCGDEKTCVCVDRTGLSVVMFGGKAISSGQAISGGDNVW